MLNCSCSLSENREVLPHPCLSLPRLARARAASDLNSVMKLCLHKVSLFTLDPFVLIHVGLPLMVEGGNWLYCTSLVLAQIKILFSCNMCILVIM